MMQAEPATRDVLIIDTRHSDLMPAGATTDFRYADFVARVGPLLRPGSGTPIRVRRHSTLDRPGVVEFCVSPSSWHSALRLVREGVDEQSLREEGVHIDDESGQRRKVGVTLSLAFGIRRIGIPETSRWYLVNVLVTHLDSV